MVHRIRSKSAGGGGGAPPGSDTYNQYLTTFTKLGPSSYDSTNGIVLDLSATYSSLNACQVIPKKGARGVLVSTRYRYVLNSPSAGKVSIFIDKHQYDAASSIGNVSGQPAGVNVEAASGVVSSAEAAHVHTMDHNHPAESTTIVVSGVGVNSSLITVGVNVSTHTHSVDVPNFTGNTSAGSSHTHVDSNIFQHQHVATLTPTKMRLVTLPNATNLSTTTWYGYVSGVRK